ncbi:Adenomatous polyposis coli protein-related protein 1 [Toxocara canis]|uniref:Adenomatous polyposis coli protein-related protein 1 n=1 Tax=Toxocara canis TaxID=6265 RepID=A0A0B2VK47_TOXCA|nr:Adenomatous polyposis coli protein-related protein 1 [Toxocara canis]
MDVDDRIADLLDSLRRRRLRHILPAANCIREQLLFLRQCLHSSTPLSTAVYVSRAHVALSDITKQSEEEEYRKLATIVGVLDAVAENLVLEVDAFGVDCGAENREIRKLIASALTNLTFGNAQSKRRLCAYPNLIDYVIRVIDDSHKLAQVYAGLLRNLSWMADAEMSATLSPTVAALTRASLRAYRGNETKCLCATLSALWNLASHSRDNKKAICEQSGFIDMIIELLTTEAQHTTLVEPASGVLKYASIYLAAVGATQLLSTLALHKMVLRLVDLLNSPSFTIIGNALGVLSQLLAKDHQLRVHVR